MHNIIYIADNTNQDMFNIEIPAFDTGAEIPAPPVKSESTEFDFFAAKSFISFGVMAVCIIIIFLISFIIKKNRNATESNKLEEPAIETVIKEEQNIPEHQPVKIKRRKSSELTTPSTISKCIRAFLENTKEN